MTAEKQLRKLGVGHGPIGERERSPVTLGGQSHTVLAIARSFESTSLKLRLPSFQRDAVWDEERVELLWDSLLRGIPIGNLVVTRTASVPSRDAQGSRYDKASSMEANGGEQDVLIDGQQRVIAIRQGLSQWSHEASSRLWIDVDPRVPQSRRGFEVRHALFLCSRGLPWGAGVSDQLRHSCRDELELHHPERVERGEFGVPDYELSLGHTWPAKASLPVPFATLATWFVSEGDNGGPPSLRELDAGEIAERVGELIHEESTCPVSRSVRERWLASRDRIVGWVSEHQRHIVRALRKEIYFEVAFQDAHPDGSEDFAADLGEAFNRLNRLGVQLDGNDLFFSAVKLQWPMAHEVVWHMYEDKEAGRILTPPQIVLAAVRLAIAEHRSVRGDSPIGDRLSLSLKDVRTILGSNAESDGRAPGIKSALEALLDVGSQGGAGYLALQFRRMRRMLEFRPAGSPGHQVPDSHDFGLPLPLLVRLGEKRPHVLHNVLHWLHRNPDADDDEATRRAVVRHALVDLLLVTPNDAYRRESFELSGTFGARFRDVEIVYLAEEQGLIVEPFGGLDGQLIASPEKWEAHLSSGDHGDPCDLKDLLFWAQRHYLATRFQDFDPTLFYNVQALPWDRDHIWPRAMMDGRSVDVQADCSVHNRVRWQYLNSFGNLCLLDRRHNRSSGASLPRTKFEHREQAIADFALGDGVFDRYRTLSDGFDRRVTDEFLATFRAAVDARRASIFRDLHTSLRLGDLRSA